MSECQGCDGSGIMWLYMGPGNNIKAPCLQCSSDRKLEDLENEQWEIEKKKIQEAERKEIEAHNQRMQGV